MIWEIQSKSHVICIHIFKSNFDLWVILSIWKSNSVSLRHRKISNFECDVNNLIFLFIQVIININIRNKQINSSNFRAICISLRLQKYPSLADSISITSILPIEQHLNIVPWPRLARSFEGALTAGKSQNSNPIIIVWRHHHCQYGFALVTRQETLINVISERGHQLTLIQLRKCRVLEILIDNYLNSSNFALPHGSHRLDQQLKRCILINISSSIHKSLCIEIHLSYNWHSMLRYHNRCWCLCYVVMI